ncbi:hypothetical protein DFA_03942 [Cavenderia fasciculata]|uniref:Transmembrane protein n=1 Tax=Cavenderia fasciculata TaxID=261658 RepID=F4Q0U7_CACFS|nr:uncharacterized protein DFA_03942 [Cavenderia fasciculata]EGG18448.1 hypothetical protein DFA_03942 [Cavenderia fasciculata]|eukprot:XP_004366352.1 hypothetical protein DFA_03942 [Cavenderia fasciculata]
MSSTTNVNQSTQLFSLFVGSMFLSCSSCNCPNQFPFNGLVTLIITVHHISYLLISFIDGCLVWIYARVGDREERESERTDILQTSHRFLVVELEY